jgi:hypothetical protein
MSTELWIEILKNLDYKSLLVVSQVNRFFNELVSLELVWSPNFPKTLVPKSKNGYLEYIKTLVAYKSTPTVTILNKHSHGVSSIAYHNNTFLTGSWDGFIYSREKGSEIITNLKCILF